ncbi:MAG: lytic transglycosylase domain-containing protein [Acetobacter sp.]|nr:lytic transglycosylase domain-containing protein [Acetobacter sp.]MCH4060093.1 lytic transglycosylase domain-containing protein [Acetobacter sp.]MCH4087033.1 lytic transglycosylase domain-containing protein [Acetobacter sp.]MCI1292853.1 lytic transglycosylase domain-containing protein [Acetobacter sp.]MCI1319439.1 lytic transglycosylase domain-containing protein [Acetobacter sp.]
MGTTAFCGRGALAVARFGLALVVSPLPGHAQDIDVMVGDAARQAAIPPSWIRAVLRVESAGDRHAISSAGAMGLMQIMPGTWRDLRRALNLGADPFDPHDNITAGAAYLRWLHDRYGDVGFLAAYNAGPGRYDDHLATGRPLPDETRAYVAAVARRMGNDAVPTFPRQLPEASPVSHLSAENLFVGPVQAATRGMMTTGAGLVPPASSSGLFVSVGWRDQP